MAAFLEVLEGRFAAALRRLCSIRGPVRVQLDPSLVPVVPMLDSFELRGPEAFPRGWRGVAQRITLPASAGNLNIVGVSNPPGSGLVFVLARLDEATPGGLIIGRGFVSGGGVGGAGWGHLDSRIFYAQIPITAFFVQQNTITPPGITNATGKVYRAPFNPNSSEPLIVIGPGNSAYYVSDNANVATDTNLVGFYRSLNPDDGF